MKTYLIVSESYKIIDEEVNKLVSPSSFVVKYDLRKDSLKDIINEASYESMLDSEKIIIVKAGDLFKGAKDETNTKNSDSSILENYLKNPAGASTIIFTSLIMPDKRKKIFKLIQEKGIVNIIPFLSKKELVYKCMDLLKHNHYKIDYETANYIVENSYNNYDIMLNELDKINMILKPSNLTIEIISDIVAKSYTNNIYGYINAVIARDLISAYQISDTFEMLKISPLMVLIMLAKEFQNLLLFKLDISYQDIQKLLKKEDWQMQSYLKNQNLYTYEELKDIIVLLNNYDYQAKSGLIDKSVLLDLVTMELCE